MTAINLSPALAAALAAISTGHESDSCHTADDLGRALGITKAQAANRLGRLKALGLVAHEPDSTGYGATWARFDSYAPGLTEEQGEILGEAERTRPAPEQGAALDAYGPQGVTPSPYLNPRVRAAIESRSCVGMAEAAQNARESCLPRLAANLFRLAATYAAGRGRRAGLEAQAALCDAIAKGDGPAMMAAHDLTETLGAYGMGRAIEPLTDSQIVATARAQGLGHVDKEAADAPAPLVNTQGMTPLQAAAAQVKADAPAAAPARGDCLCLECGRDFDSLGGSVQVCPRCYPMGRAMADAQALPELAKRVKELESELGRRDAQDKARAYDAPALRLPSPYILTAWARHGNGEAVALVRLPDNAVTPWACYRVDLDGICTGGDYVETAAQARGAFLDRLANWTLQTWAAPRATPAQARPVTPCDACGGLDLETDRTGLIDTCRTCGAERA